jgi:hypothetical protein
MVAGLQRKEGYKAAPPNPDEKSGQALPEREAYKEFADSISSLIFIVSIADKIITISSASLFLLKKVTGRNSFTQRVAN